MSMTPVPVCWQTTVTAEMKRILLYRILRLRRVAQATFYHSAAVRSARAFLSYGNEVSYTIKIIKNVPWHSRAEARLLRQPSTPAPSAHPRGAFLSYGNEVSYTIKITGGAYKPHPFTFHSHSPDVRNISSASRQENSPSS